MRYVMQCVMVGWCVLLVGGCPDPVVGPDPDAIDSGYDGGTIDPAGARPSDWDAAAGSDDSVVGGGPSDWEAEPGPDDSTVGGGPSDWEAEPGADDSVVGGPSEWEAEPGTDDGAGPSGWVCESWPKQEGVTATFVPSGLNYGNLGELHVVNSTDEAVTVTVPPGLLLDSKDPTVQDLYVINVPTETPCSGGEKIGEPITVGPDGSCTIEEVPGVCPDYELDPPTKGDSENYTCMTPDEKGEELVSVVETAKDVDISEMELKVFKPEKAVCMITQGACWMTDSRLDEVPGNEVTEDEIEDRFWGTFVTAAGEKLTSMPPEQKETVEETVQSDIEKIVEGISFVTKEHTPDDDEYDIDDDDTEDTDDDDTDDTDDDDLVDDGTVIEIGDKDGGPGLAAPPKQKKPCKYCRMIVIYGPSQKYNGTTDKYEITDKPIEKAHDTAADFAARAKDCLIVVHPKWRTGGPDAHVLREKVDAEGKVHHVWGGTNKYPLGIDTTQSDGEDIDCYSEVLLIYHGTKKQTTKNALKWLEKNTKAPIKKLVLWSCWGSRKIDAKTVKPILKTMAKRAAKNEDCDCDMEIFTSNNVKPTEAMVAHIKSKSKRKKIMNQLAGFSTPLGIYKNASNMVLTAPELKFKKYTYDGKKVQLQEGVESNELFGGVPIRVDTALTDRGFAKEFLGK